MRYRVRLSRQRKYKEWQISTNKFVCAFADNGIRVIHLEIFNQQFMPWNVFKFVALQKSSEAICGKTIVIKHLHYRFAEIPSEDSIGWILQAHLKLKSGIKSIIGDYWNIDTL